jgi:hypothetical protein
MIEQDGKKWLVREQKCNNPATYKQYKYLMSFDNVEMTISTSQFVKYIDRDEASEAIEEAKTGAIIVVE